MNTAELQSLVDQAHARHVTERERWQAVDAPLTRNMCEALAVIALHGGTVRRSGWDFVNCSRKEQLVLGNGCGFSTLKGLVRRGLVETATVQEARGPAIFKRVPTIFSLTPKGVEISRKILTVEF